MSRISELMEDMDGGLSAKRLVFFMFCGLFVILTVACYLHQFDKDTLGFVKDALEKITELIKWLGGFIVAERPAQAIATIAGKKANG